MPPTTSSHARGVPTSTPAWSSPILARKPDSGGMPERFIAETKKRVASTGEAMARPPSRSSDVVPARRSTRPVMRKSAVWIVMWCAT